MNELVNNEFINLWPAYSTFVLPTGLKKNTSNGVKTNMRLTLIHV